MIKNILFILLISLLSLAEIDYKKELTALQSIGEKKLNVEDNVDLIIIDFWASWCDPCKESFPYYDAKIKAQKDKKIVFVSVNLDDKIAKAKDFLKDHPQNHITVWDESKKLMEELGFDSIPFMVILDGNWKEKERIRGFNDKTKKRLNKYF